VLPTTSSCRQMSQYSKVTMQPFPWVLHIVIRTNHSSAYLPRPRFCEHATGSNHLPQKYRKDSTHASRHFTRLFLVTTANLRNNAPFTYADVPSYSSLRQTESKIHKLSFSARPQKPLPFNHVIFKYSQHILQALERLCVLIL
jgi:hypothetical protein